MILGCHPIYRFAGTESIGGVSIRNTCLYTSQNVNTFWNVLDDQLHMIFNFPLKHFFKIMIPLMKPSFAAMGIYQGMQSWNNFLWPMIVTNSIDKITLPVGLQSLLSPYGNNYDILIAGSCFAIIPILALFVCFQRYFIEGMTAGGVKG